MCKRHFQGFSGDAHALWAHANPQGIFGIRLRSNQVFWVEATQSPAFSWRLGFWRAGTAPESEWLVWGGFP